MNKEDWHDLIQKQLAGKTTPEEKATLEATLEEDAELRTLYLDYANLDMALEASAEAEAALKEAQLIPGESGKKIVWFSRRSIATAAAGIMIGALTSSMVWAFSGARPQPGTRVEIPLGNPGFEELTTPLPGNLPRMLNQWIGDTSHEVIPGSGSTRPNTGQAMLKIMPVDFRHMSRIEQIVEVGHLLPPEGGRVELTAALRSIGAEDDSRFNFKLRAFYLEGAEIDGSTEDIQDLVIAEADRAFFVPPGFAGWKVRKLGMDLPPGTKTLSLAISVRDLPESSAEAARYLDDVRLELLVQ